MKHHLSYLLSCLIALALLSCSKEQTPGVDPDCADTVSFKASILPLIENNCISCHDNGTLPVLSNYDNISTHASKILNSMNGIGSGGVMPQDASPIHPDTIQKFACWINQGKLDN